MLKKYALIGLTAVSGAATGMHYAAKGWQGIEDYAYDTYRHSRLSRYISLLDSEDTPDIDKIVKDASERYQLPEALLRGLIHIESGNRAEAQSPKGAIGLSQIMPANSKRCNVRINQLWDERINIMCGAQILSEELAMHKNVRKALESYNGGNKCINKCQESIKYASNVMMKTAEYLVK